MPTPKTYKISIPSVMEDLLNKTGFTPVVVKRVEPMTLFPTYQAFLDWCLGTMPANWRIPEAKQREACIYFVKRFLIHTQQDDRDANSPLRFPGHRMDVVAVKK